MWGERRDGSAAIVMPIVLTLLISAAH